MYGCGLRINEALNIRIKDIDFGFDKVYIWDSKSLTDRTVPLPQAVKQRLKAQVEYVEGIHSKDPRSEVIRRYHVHEKTLGRNIKQASVKVHKYTKE
jgi:integrase